MAHRSVSRSCRFVALAHQNLSRRAARRQQRLPDADGRAQHRPGRQVALTFDNADSVPHNLTFRDPIDAGTSTVVAPGTSETLEFEAPEPGSYPFVCTLHPGMDGTLEVTP